MAVTEKLKNLVDQMPDPDGRGMYTENINKGKIEKVIASIAEGGRENLLGLIEMLGVHPAPLRAWVRLSPEEAPGTVRLDAFAREVLGVRAGAMVILRKMPTVDVPGGLAS